MITHSLSIQFFDASTPSRCGVPITHSFTVLKDSQHDFVGRLAANIGKIIHFPLFTLKNMLPHHGSPLGGWCILMNL